MSDWLHERELAVLLLCDAEEKVAATRELVADWRAGRLARETDYVPQAVPLPGAPASLQLVAPKALPKRKLSRRDGMGALLHAVCHIEFNAINLALDASYRFPAMPTAYHEDWLQVAWEEALHFELMAQRLASFGYRYGDFPAHNGLWQMALDTAADPLARMALVPRVMEARGLDVTPGMIDRVSACGDTETVDVLRIILRDEVGHVRIGSRWYYHLCQQRDLPPVTTFLNLVGQYSKGAVKGPFNTEARLDAGFSRSELRHLDQFNVTTARSVSGQTVTREG